ncbi:MAG: hypothetical protein ACKOW8_00395 [Flavobacteriales bacterium]
MKPFQNTQYIGQAFKQFGRDGGAYIGLMLLATLSYLILSMIPAIGSVLTTLVCAPMVAGIFLFIRIRETGESADFSKFFGVFSNRYYLAFVAQNIFVSLITIIAFGIAGMLFLGEQLETILSAFEQMQSGNERDVESALNLIFGSHVVLAGITGLIISIVISTLYFFAPLFVVLRDLSFWAALEESRKYASKRFWEVLILLVLIILLNVAGALLCCIGLLVSIPVSYLAMYNAFNDQMESNSSL